MSDINFSEISQRSMNEANDPYQLTIEEIDENLLKCKAENPSTIEALRNLLWHYRGVFYKKPGRIKEFKYEFQLKDTTPFFVKPYPIPINHRNQVRTEIQKMLDWGIIRRSNSKYISPLMTSEKKRSHCASMHRRA